MVITMQRLVPKAIALCLFAGVLACSSNSTPTDATSSSSGASGSGSSGTGSSGGQNDTAFWRSLLAGDGSTMGGGATTTRSWIVIARRTAEAGADTPCVENPSTTSDECPTTMFRSDGKWSSSLQKGSTGYPRFSDTWEVDGATVKQIMVSSLDTFTTISTAVDEGMTGGRRRMRLLGVSFQDPRGVTDRQGSSTLYEEVP